MNTWDSRIRDHRIWGEMKALGSAIDLALATPEISLTNRLGIERIRTVLEYLGKRIAAADPLLTPPQILDSLSDSLVSIRGQLEFFAANGQDGHIQNANAMADAMVSVTSQIPGDYSPEELGKTVAAVSSYRNIVADALRSDQESIEQFSKSTNEKLSSLSTQVQASIADFGAKAQALQTSLTTLSSSIDAERQRIATTTAEQQSQFSAAQDARSTQFNENLRASTEQINKLVTDYQSQFSLGQDTRSKENAAAENARQTKFNETIAEYNKKLAEQNVEFTQERVALAAEAQDQFKRLTEEYEQKVSTLLKEVEEKRSHVEKLVGVIGNLGVTSGYLRNANNARIAMWGWQGGTLLSLITLSVLAYKTLGTLEDHTGHFNWGAFAARALLLVSLGVIAAYCGTQGDKQSTDERRSRKLALELEAIGPYLAPLPEDEQNKFRVQIGERSFGRDLEHIEQNHKSPTSVLAILKSKEGKEALKLLMELLEKARETAK